eukprot:3616483-Rhodomonas_salina.1
MEQIVRFYKRKGFPPGFLKALKRFRCKVCAVAKAGCVYKHDLGGYGTVADYDGTAVRDKSADVSHGGSAELHKNRPSSFAYQDCNEIWRILASQMLEGYEALADINMLEPDPANHTQAMKNPRL